MKKRTIKISTATAMALALFCLPAAAQVGISSDTHTVVTTKKTVTEAIPAPTLSGATSVQTTVTTESAPATTRSETHWVTEEKAIVTPGARVYNVADFDLNNDSILSVNEVGEKLFKMYDTDGNNIIDNMEFERRAVLTVVPVEKNTVITYDFDGDGVSDKVTQTSEVFLQETRLGRFDKNGDGLSPREFTARSFLEADINNDKAIDLSEWKGAYIASIDVKNKVKAQVNH